MTRHHGATRIPGASHSVALPVERSSAVRAFRPYPALKVRNALVAESRASRCLDLERHQPTCGRTRLTSVAL